MALDACARGQFRQLRRDFEDDRVGALAEADAKGLYRLLAARGVIADPALPGPGLFKGLPASYDVTRYPPLIVERRGLPDSLEITAGVLASCLVTSMVVRQFFGHSFSTWRLHLRGETISSARDIGWLRNLTVDSMMRTDVRTASDMMTIAECRQAFRLGSSQAIFVVDGKGKYRGVVSLPEVFSSDRDNAADTMKLVELAHHGGTLLAPSMNVKTAMACFEQAGADVLPVVDAVSGDTIVGFLTEAYARRRYMQELDRSIAGVARAL